MPSDVCKCGHGVEEHLEVTGETHPEFELTDCVECSCQHYEERRFRMTPNGEVTWD